MGKSKRERDKKALHYADASERARKHERGFSRTSFRVPKKIKEFDMRKYMGKSAYLDFVPFIAGKGNPMSDPGMPWWERTIFVHKGTGPGGKDTVICNARTLSKPCGGCKAIQKLSKNRNMDKDALKQMREKEQQGFFVIDRDNLDDGVQLYQSAYYMSFGELLDEELSDLKEKDPRRRFYSLDKGFTLKLRVKKGRYNGRPYPKVTKIVFEPRDEQYEDVKVDEDEKTIKFTLGENKFMTVCMDDLIQEYDAKKLYGYMMEGPVEDEEDTKARAKSRDDDEDDDEEEDEDDEDDDTDDDEDEDEDDEDDDDDEPKKKGKKSKKDDDDDDEDEDEEDDEDEDDEDDEDEDEEDDEPKKKKKKPSKDDEDDEDDDEEDEDDDDDDEDDEPKKKKSKAVKKGKKKKKDEDDDEDDEDDETPF